MIILLTHTVPVLLEKSEQTARCMWKSQKCTGIQRLWVSIIIVHPKVIYAGLNCLTWIMLQLSILKGATPLVNIEMDDDETYAYGYYQACDAYFNEHASWINYKSRRRGDATCFASKEPTMRFFRSLDDTTLHCMNSVRCSDQNYNAQSPVPRPANNSGWKLF